MRLLSFLLLLGTTAWAQTIVPLAGYPQLDDKRGASVLELRVDCEDTVLPGVERLVTGGASSLRIDLDTAGLGSDLDDYRCIGCDELRFGEVDLQSDTVNYSALDGVEQGLDTFGVTVCSPAGVCADTVEIVVLVQRPGRTIDLGGELLSPSSRTVVDVPPDELPGGAVCRTISACAEDYAGRGQLSFFRSAMASGNDFEYRAARYGGTDTVCVTLCNELGLCDTYRAAFTIEREVSELPFFDDFSGEGNRPDSSLWQDEDVLINRNYSETPPSIGVATFDAIDLNGRPYRAAGNARRTVPRDYLTSNPVDLAGRTQAVLSFYLQPRGLGNRPELQDSFLVQFLDQEGEWATVFSREGLPITVPNNEVVGWTGYTVPVPATYAYTGFQFRFVNQSAERGAVDNWHLDYVKLSDRSTTLITQDLALTEAPFRLVAPYTSLPVRHLQAAGQQLLVDSIALGVWNHRADVTPITASDYRIESLGDPSFSVERGLFPSSFFGQDNGIAPDTFERRRADFTALPSYEAVRAFLFGLDPEGDYTLATTYELTVATEDASFDPAVARNNRAEQRTELADYMAYDDGSAELAIEGQPGNIIVQRYTAFVEDRLIGVRIRLPRGLNATGSQPLELLVYGAGEEGQPGELLYSAEEPVLYAEDVFLDSLQAFTSYVITEEIDLPVGDFYVGWRQSSAQPSLPIGLDRNNRPADVQFFDSGSGWRPLEGATRGAIMIRPLLEGANVMPTSVDDEELSLSVFPNPTDGVINLRLEGEVAQLVYRLFSADGRLLAHGRGVERIDLSPYPSGVYLLECHSGGQRSRHKIVRR